MTITEFLLARIAEDERWADERMQGRFAPIPNETELPGTAARVFSECEAKRRIVETFCAVSDSPGIHVDAFTVARDVLRDLALPYADHPDYDEAWRPA